MTTPDPTRGDTVTEHVLNTRVRPAACSCGGFKAAGSPTFVRERFAIHVDDATDRPEETP